MVVGLQIKDMMKAQLQVSVKYGSQSVGGFGRANRM